MTKRSLNNPITVITPEITQLGITLNDEGAVLTVWAPHAKTVVCQLRQPAYTIELERGAYGYWHASSKQISAGRLYHIVVDGKVLTDPTSRSQPEGVHGPSAVVDLAYNWHDAEYTAPALRDYVIYELHVGTFTATHDFEGVIARLPYLQSLGITAIELMPVNQFPGERNWGYDGVYTYAVQHSYGGAKGLQRLVDACHQHGIAVVLDVVYNHFGPEGNYLPEYGPYFTDKYHTPWGSAINFDDAHCNGVRDFVLENVRMWFRDFHIDALRLDAVHAIKDFGSRHILQDIARETAKWNVLSGRKHYLIAECDLNNRLFLESPDINGFGMDAQWIDEFHHALRVAAGGERNGYYADFQGIVDLAKAYEQAYVFNGNYSEHRKKFFGSSTESLAGEQFIVFSQNHDQVGNRMLGERSSTLFSSDMQRLMAFSVMISPYVPMLFMGEEWGASTPFQYFVSHGDKELIQAVREGRKKEFAAFHGDEETPDPQAEITFDRCVLDWEEKESGQHKNMLQFYKALIGFRTHNPVLRHAKREDFSTEVIQEKETIILRIKQHKHSLLCLLNFSTSHQEISIPDTLLFSNIFDTASPEWGGETGNPKSFTSKINLLASSGAVYQHTHSTE